MDFQINKGDFTRALRQILQGRNADSHDLVDMTAMGGTLSVVIMGRSIEVAIQTRENGSFQIPIGVLFKMKRISSTYGDEIFRIRVSEGRFRLQGMSVSNPEIKAKAIVRRIIDIPDDASPRDLLSLRLIFSVDEIGDSGLHARVLEAQKDLTENLNSAYDLLSAYGVGWNDLSSIISAKIKGHAETMKRVIFNEDHLERVEEPEKSEITKLSTSKEQGEMELHRRTQRMKLCKHATESGDRFAFMYAEWADRSQFEFYIGWHPDMFSDEMIEGYRKAFPDRKLGESPWWEV